MEHLDYKSSGVDVDANARWTKWIAQSVKQDRNNHGITHVGAIGGFAGAMKLPPMVRRKVSKAIVQKISRECFNTKTSAKGLEYVLEHTLDSFSLVACTDGVGTKTMIAEKLGRLETLGYDLLAMNVNDMVAGGATPIAFLDYIGCHHIEKDGKYCYQPFVEGLIKACREIDVELIGGETAEMGDNYTEFGSDLTGFALGILTEEDIPRSETIKSGDLLLGLRSSGIHSNGYSLVRKTLEKNNIGYDDHPAELNGKSVADVLLEPTRLYVKQALAANATGKVKGMAHITGGGLVENIERVLPSELSVHLKESVIGDIDVFRWLAGLGLDHSDMLKTFNMGYGFVFVVSHRDLQTVYKAIDENISVIGYIE